MSEEPSYRRTCERVGTVEASSEDAEVAVFRAEDSWEGRESQWVVLRVLDIPHAVTIQLTPQQTHDLISLLRTAAGPRPHSTH